MRFREEQAAHIKRHTKGTSNEISFDVLDAARDDLDNTKTPLFKTRRSTKDTSLALSNDGAPSVVSAEEEIERRKKKRKASMWRTRILVIVLIIALGVGVGVFLKDRQDRQMDYASRFKNLVGQIAQIDETLVRTDELLAHPLESVSEPDWADVKQQTVANQQRLATIKDTAVRLAEQAESDQDKIAIGQVIEAIDQRLVMTQRAVRVLDEADDADAAIGQANLTWQHLLDADVAARLSNSLLEGISTDEEIAQALEQAEAARTSFEAVLAETQYLETLYPNQDTSAQQDYINKRIEALDTAVESDNALLVEDKQRASDLNELYNQLEAEAALLAEQLPSTPTQFIREEYARRVESELDLYQQARNQVSLADAIIRDYLNDEGK